MRTWLVTGASGFIGRHVMAELRTQADPGCRIVGCGRVRPRDLSGPDFFEVDLESREAVEEMVRDLAPDVVIHAAGATPPGDADRSYRANTQTTINLIAALSDRGLAARFILVGSAAELGHVDHASLPVGEDHPCRPRGDYGRSKWEATKAALKSPRPVEAIVGRVFNPIGPGMPDSLAFGRFANRLASPGPDPLPLTVGNLGVRRDFIDVRDVAGALIALARGGESSKVYHIGTGRSRSVGDGLAYLIKRSGRRLELTDAEGVGTGPADSRADIRRITSQTGWIPLVSWEKSLDDLWESTCSRHERNTMSPSEAS